MSRLSHAYIAGGQAVYDIAQAALCSGVKESNLISSCGKCKHCDKSNRRIHPDVIEINILGDNKGITINQIREIKTDAYIAPNEASRKVYIVHNADTMNQYAQNAFLQLLEEPPSHAVFILNTSNPAALLPTVRSRCVTSRGSSHEAGHNYFSEDLSEVSGLAADFADSLGDNMRLTRCMFQLEKLDRYAFSDFLTLTREELGAKLRSGNNLNSIVKADALITKAFEMMKVNINSIHISSVLCAELLDFQ